MILNISEAANLGIHAMTYLAAHVENQPISVAEIAAYLDASEAHLVKVMQRLKRVGLVKSLRGPRGGFSLTRAASEISLLDIYQGIDGVLPHSHCVFNNTECELDQCVFGSLLPEISQQVNDHFSTTVLTDLVDKKST